MRALALSGSDASAEIQDVPTPEPAAGEVRVKVRAASINGFDLSVASGGLQGYMEYRFPVVIGKDYAGTIDAVGEGVDSFSVGDEVFGVVMKADLHDGSISEYTTVAAAVGVAKRPEELSVIDAGALGLAGSAALGALDGTKLANGDVVLVSGATGGVGSVALQLAKGLGATVIATASTDDERALVLDLGADHVVSFDFADEVKEIAPTGVDVALHLAGELDALLGSVRDGGRIASTLGATQEHVGERDVALTSVMANPDEVTLDRLAQAATSGTLRVQVQQTYTLEDAATALEDFKQGTLGKLAIDVAGAGA